MLFRSHPAEASHGDLGMVTRDDVFIALSNSGESAELLAIMPVIKRQGAKLIAMTGNAASTLAREADAHLYAGADKEACPLNLAPTASTTAALALGDALAVALMSAKGFSKDDFAAAHPGGALGRKLLTHVRDVMRTDTNAPRIAQNASVLEGMLEMTRGRMGMTAVLDETGRVIGIFTDGDLRRLVEKGADLRALTAAQVMHPNPRTLKHTALAVEAAEMMEEHRITSVLVVDELDALCGAINSNDLMRAKVI